MPITFMGTEQNSAETATRFVEKQIGRADFSVFVREILSGSHVLAVYYFENLHLWKSWMLISAGCFEGQTLVPLFHMRAETDLPCCAQ